jgi:23S rRNA (pseudouridine1915-N3)-methyltransferase
VRRAVEAERGACWQRQEKDLRSPCRWRQVLTTGQLARWLEDRAREGDAPFFCIGGPDGLAPEIDAEARLSWSLSALTLPHGLARVVVAEALYRAVSLIKGLPYHRA